MTSLRALLLSVATAAAFSPAAGAEQEWKTSAGAQPAFAAAIHTDGQARLVVECRVGVFVPPEVLKTVWPHKGAVWRTPSPPLWV